MVWLRSDIKKIFSYIDLEFCERVSSDHTHTNAHTLTVKSQPAHLGHQGGEGALVLLVELVVM